MTANNEKWHIKEPINDLDAVSLYPSAQSRLYYPAGKAKVLTKEMIEYYNNKENLMKIKED